MTFSEYFLQNWPHEKPSTITYSDDRLQFVLYGLTDGYKAIAYVTFPSRASTYMASHHVPRYDMYNPVINSSKEPTQDEIYRILTAQILTHYEKGVGSTFLEQSYQIYMASGLENRLSFNVFKDKYGHLSPQQMITMLSLLTKGV